MKTNLTAMVCVLAISARGWADDGDARKSAPREVEITVPGVWKPARQAWPRPSGPA